MGRLADLSASNPAAPVNPEELYNVIAGISSQDPTVLKASTARFEEMLQLQGTFHALNAIATTRSVPLNIRQQAIIQFKNKALGQWRSKRLSSDEQKSEMRVKSLSLLDERDEVIADCNKFVIAKIARIDYPSQWSSLMPELLAISQKSLDSVLSSGGNDMNAYLVSNRALGIINTILKELASIKMPSGIRVTGQLVNDLSQPFQALYFSLAQSQMSLLNPNPSFTQQTAGVTHLVHLLYKSLSKMAAWAWGRICASSFKELKPWVETFYRSSCEQFTVLTDLRSSLVSSLNLNNERPKDEFVAHSVDMLSRQVRHFGKFFRRMQQYNVAKFVGLPGSDNVVFFYWSKVVQATNGPQEQISDSQYAVFPVRFLVQALVIFRECLGQWSLTKQGHGGVHTFSKEFVEEAVGLLVTRFIPLNPKDIDAWLADPEEWANTEDKESEQWEYELRPCGERVLMTFAKQYTDFVTPLLRSTFERVAGTNASDVQAIVQKEALYCAIGRCARYLMDDIPFDQWVSTSLVAEARDTNPNFPIIKRRIAWLIGKWIGDECSKPTADVWNILVHLLSDRGPGSDSVVRFAAASALRECIDSLSFNVDVFSPYIPTVIPQLISLVREAETLEAKRRVTQCLNVLISSVSERIVPFIEAVAMPVPELWKEAEGDSAEYIFKSSLLDTVTNLIEATKQHSVALNSISVPILQECFLNETARSKLDEDGLRLWQAALQNNVTLDAVGGAPSLMDVFPIAIDLLADNLDLLGSITSIIRSYLVLDPAKILQLYPTPLFAAMYSAFKKALQSNQIDIINLLQFSAQLAPVQIWAEHLHSSGLLSELLKIIVEDEAQTQLLTAIVCMIARLAINDSNILCQLIAASALAMGKPESEVMNGVLDQWWRRFDNMSEPRQRKLLAMGIACLVATGRPEVLERLSGEVFNLWLDVFGEMKEALLEMSQGDEDPSQSTLSSLVLFWKDDGSELPCFLDDLKDKPEYERWKRIYSLDPVETQKLTSFVAQCLQRAGAVCPDLENRYLANGDPAVLKQLQTHLSS